MRTLLLAVVLALPSVLPPTPRDDAELDLRLAANRLYTWGHRVERFTCRVRGRWRQFGALRRASGLFFGDLEYRAGEMRFRITRARGAARDARVVTQDIRALVGQVGLFPTGLPIPAGRVNRRSKEHGVDYVVTPGGNAVPLTFRVIGDRLAGVSWERSPAGPRRAFAIETRAIPGGRYLVRQIVSQEPGRRAEDRVCYFYHFLAGDYFPRAINEERSGQSLSLAFFNYEIELVE